MLWLLGVIDWAYFTVHWIRRPSAKSLARGALLGSVVLAGTAVVDVLYTGTFSTLTMMMIGFAALGFRRYWSVFRSGRIRFDQTRQTPKLDGSR